MAIRDFTKKGLCPIGVYASKVIEVTHFDNAKSYGYKVKFEDERLPNLYISGKHEHLLYAVYRELPNPMPEFCDWLLGQTLNLKVRHIQVEGMEYAEVLVEGQA